MTYEGLYDACCVGLEPLGSCVVVGFNEDFVFSVFCYCSYGAIRWQQVLDVSVGQPVVDGSFGFSH